MKASRWYKPALVLLAGLLFSGVFLTQRWLNRERQRMDLTRMEPLENAPPVLAFTTVALGGFRGIIANALWIRAMDLQEQDKFFEMVQLADWITKLQPHFTTVWVNQAWNMAYNISIKFPEPSDRWKWVYRGIELLRDEGLRYNPKEPLIYRELAWIFQHKMGMDMDDAHDYFKEVWARQMFQVLGSGHPDFDTLIHPDTPEAAARAQRLKEEYKMDPAVMKEVDEIYGPLEWRLPESSAIYWGYLGLKKCGDGGASKDQLLTLRRVIFQSMQLAFMRGRLTFPDPNGQEFMYGPNLDITGKTYQAYEDQIEAEDRSYMKENIARAEKNFLRTAVYFLYTHNRVKEAEKWFDTLVKKYPLGALNEQELAEHGQHPDQPIPQKSMEEFAMDMVSMDVGETSHTRVTDIIRGLISNAFTSAALGQDDQYAGFLLLAHKVYNRFQASIGGSSAKRVGLDPFDKLRNDVLSSLLNPETGLRPYYAARLRTELNLPAASTNAPGTNSPVVLPRTGEPGNGGTNAPAPAAVSSPNR